MSSSVCHGCNSPADVYLTTTGLYCIECEDCRLSTAPQPRYEMALRAWEHLQHAVITVNRHSGVIEEAKRRYKNNPHLGPYITPEEAAKGPPEFQIDLPENYMEDKH